MILKLVLNEKEIYVLSDFNEKISNIEISILERMMLRLAINKKDGFNLYRTFNFSEV